MLIAILFWLGVAGLVASTGFLLLTAVAVFRFRSAPEEAPNPSAPLVALFKPLCGLEPGLEENLESFFRQDYPRYEIVFGTVDASDPALRVVQTVRRRHPGVQVQIVYSGPPDRPNAKVSTLERMYAATAADYLIISDSDTRVNQHYIRSVLQPLLDPRVGVVTCPYRGVPTGGLWSRLEALGMSVEMTSGVLVANLLEGMRFALGPTMAVRRDALQSIGGMGSLGEYCADDYVLGNRAFHAGWQVVLSHHVIEHIVIGRSFRDSMHHQVRWMKSTRFSRGLGHLGSVLTFSMPFGLLAMAAALASGNLWLAAGMFGWAFFNRMALSVLTGWGVVRDPRALWFCWLYPLRDFIGFCTWCASYFGNTVVWRQQRYRVHEGGKITPLGPLAGAPAKSETVAVDRLA
jgi:ceramide glucosyltransferase